MQPVRYGLLIFSCFLFIFSASFLTLRIWDLGNVNDEGLMVYGAKKVLDGQVPYRDFWTLYPPGQFYLLAVLFKIFGTNLFVERVYSVIVQSGFVVLVFLIAAAVTNRISGLVVWSLTLSAVLLVGSHGNGALYLAFFLILLSSYLICKVFEQRNTNFNIIILLAGFLCAISTLLRSDLGFYGFLGCALGLFFAFGKISQSAASIGTFCLGYFLPLVIVLLLLVQAGPFKNIIYDLVIFPLVVYPKVRQLSILDSDIRYLFYLVTAVYILSVAILPRSRKIFESEVIKWKFTLLLSIGTIFLFKAVSRLDFGHLLPALVISFICLAVLNKSIFGAKDKIFLYFRVVFVAFSITVLAVVSTNFFPIKMFAAGYVPISDDQMSAVLFIKESTREGEYVFVGNTRHDRLVANDILFYFLAQRDSPTKYWELHPGVANTLNVQTQIVEDLEGKSVDWVVLFSGFDNYFENNESSVASGVVTLDKYLGANFTDVAKFGFYRILERRN